MTWDLMYDAVHDRVSSIPSNAAKVAGYVSGSITDYWWTATDWAKFPHAAHIRIDTDGSKPLQSDVLDVEQGDASPDTAGAWCRARQDHGWWSAVYCSEASAPAVRAAMAAHGVSKYSLWLAHWGITQAEAAAKLGGDVVAVQFASPSTNPQLGCDVSVALSTWFPTPGAPAPVPTEHGILVTMDPANQPAARLVQSADGGKSWH